MLEGAATRFGEAPYVARKRDEGWIARSFRKVNQDAQALASARRHPLRGEPQLGNRGVRDSQGGGISVPLSIQLQPKEIAFRLEHSEAWGVLVSHNQLEKLLKALGGHRGRLRLIYLDEEREMLGEDLSRHGSELLLFDALMGGGRELLRQAEVNRRLAALREEISPEDVAIISYTSGTTGNPKGIMLTH